MRLEILAEAQADLIAGYRFYEVRAPGLGGYFLDSLFADIDSLRLDAGVHRVVLDFHRALSRRFPFAIYYRTGGGCVWVYAVLDCRRNPTWVQLSLKMR
jgi:hypothetical protein